MFEKGCCYCHKRLAVGKVKRGTDELMNSKFVWMRIDIGEETWIVVNDYRAESERDREERKSFWELLRECLENFTEKKE